MELAASLAKFTENCILGTPDSLPFWFTSWPGYRLNPELGMCSICQPESKGPPLIYLSLKRSSKSAYFFDTFS